MRKIKLQMTTSIDGFVKPLREGGESAWDKDVTDFCIDNLSGVDTILLGRTTVEGFIPYWSDVATDQKSEFNQLGKALTDIPKVAFSNKLEKSNWDNATVIGGDLKEAIGKLKCEEGGDIMVYGGVRLASSLIEHDLVDEFYFLVYPYAAGAGESIFAGMKTNALMTLKTCKSFGCGLALLVYERRR